jgi:hypothetical protein
LSKNVILLLMAPLLAIVVSGLVLKGGLMAQTVDPENEMVILNVVHGIPDAEVDVCLRGEVPEDEFIKVLEDLSFTDIEILEAPAGTYDVALVPVGEECDVPISGLTAENLPAAPGDNISVIAHLTEDGEDFVLTFGKNETAKFVQEKISLITVYHAAAAPRVDVRAGKFHPVREFFTFIGNGEFGTYDVRPSQYLLAIVPAGEPPTEAVVEAHLPLYVGSHTIVYAVGSLEEGTFALLTQAFRLEEKDEIY